MSGRSGGSGGGGGRGASGATATATARRRRHRLPNKTKTLLLFDSNNLRGGPFGYVFYVDVAANLAEEAPQNALRHLQEIAPFMRVLGCYPVADAAE